MVSKTLTRRQKEIFDCIEEYFKTYSKAPSYRELLHKLNLKSPATLHGHIQRLVKKGVLHNQPGISRSITLEPSNKKISASIPLLGSLGSSSGIHKFQTPQSISFPTELLEEYQSIFALKVVDNGFMEECIASGDILILIAPEEVEGSHMSLLLINQHAALIKICSFEGEDVYLTSRYTSHQPIVLNREKVHIYGIVIHILRSM